MFSQEIHSIYKFKKQKQKKNLTYYVLDSLVLFKNGNFHNTHNYNYHEIVYNETKGNWRIENGILILDVNEKKEIFKDPIWKKKVEKYQYKIKGKRLIPIVTVITEKNAEKEIINYYYIPPKKLRLVTD
jgi:hypothetical protein